MHTFSEVMLLHVLLCTFLCYCVGVQAQEKDGYQPTSSTSESVKSIHAIILTVNACMHACTCDKK